jgi:hypothetical protein
MKKHYLVIVSTYFVDPHGSAEFGGMVKRIEFTDNYNDLDLSKTYNEDLDEVDVDGYEGSEDGYNSEYNELEIRELSENEAIKYTEVIKQYTDLK